MSIDTIRKELAKYDEAVPIRVVEDWIDQLSACRTAAEDRFEQFVAAAIAKSPEPLRELGEYLTRLLDEDQWPKAEAMLLQLATTHPAKAVPEGEVSPASRVTDAVVQGALIAEMECIEYYQGRGELVAPEVVMRAAIIEAFQVDARSHPAPMATEPCELGEICLGCEPRNADGSCPDAAPAASRVTVDEASAYARGYRDGYERRDIEVKGALA